jgi:hypothetical protein
VRTEHVMPRTNPTVCGQVRWHWQLLTMSPCPPPYQTIPPSLWHDQLRARRPDMQLRRTVDVGARLHAQCEPK